MTDDVPVGVLITAAQMTGRAATWAMKSHDMLTEHGVDDEAVARLYEAAVALDDVSTELDFGRTETRFGGGDGQ